MYVCVCVCVVVCMRICMSLCERSTRPCLLVCCHSSFCLYLSLHVCGHIHTYIHTERKYDLNKQRCWRQTHTHTHTHTYIYTYINIYIQKGNTISRNKGAGVEVCEGGRWIARGGDSVCKSIKWGVMLRDSVREVYMKVCIHVYMYI